MVDQFIDCFIYFDYFLYIYFQSSIFSIVFFSNLKEIADAMKSNSILEELNMESNFLTRDAIHELLAMLECNTTLKEFKLSNQVSAKEDSFNSIANPRVISKRPDSSRKGLWVQMSRGSQ